MPRYHPGMKRYGGPIHFDSQPTNWMKEHRSFASREWFRSQVQYGEWERDGRKRNCFLIYVAVVEGVKDLTVIIKIKYFQTHVLIYHAHVLRKK